MSDKNKKSAIEAAYTYLDTRMRTRAEVENKLKEKGYTEEEILEAVNELIRMRYLDDYQYALRYFEYNREKRRGSGRAARELAEKGIDSETIRNAREDYLYTEKADEYSDALAVAEKELELRSGPVVWDDKLAAKIARKLDGRGFDRSDIYRVLDAIRRKYDR
jgi:regulatory protein